jgi:excisionase family DNA binding protein
MRKKYLTTTEAAQLCKVTRFTVRNWVNNGRLKSSRTLGGHRRILREDLMKFMKKNMVAVISRDKIPARVNKTFLYRGIYDAGKHFAAITKAFSKKKK